MTLVRSITIGDLLDDTAVRLPEVMKNVVEKMGIREITIAYGQTESSPVITQTRPGDSIERRVATVGRAHDGWKLR